MQPLLQQPARCVDSLQPMGEEWAQNDTVLGFRAYKRLLELAFRMKTCRRLCLLSRCLGRICSLMRAGGRIGLIAPACTESCRAAKRGLRLSTSHRASPVLSSPTYQCAAPASQVLTTFSTERPGTSFRCGMPSPPPSKAKSNHLLALRSHPLRQSWTNAHVGPVSSLASLQRMFLDTPE